LRRCKICGFSAWNEEELVLFKTERQCRFGHQELCKVCKAKQDAKYRYQHTKKYSYTKESREGNKIAALKYRQHNPEKVVAHYKANQLLPTGTSCERCGSTEQLVKHHPDYREPLHVVTLCYVCHRLVHSKFPEEAHGRQIRMYQFIEGV
jgi:hypothetical protein